MNLYNFLCERSVLLYCDIPLNKLLGTEKCNQLEKYFDKHPEQYGQICTYIKRSYPELFQQDSNDMQMNFVDFYDVDTPGAKVLVSSWPIEGLLVEHQLIFASSVDRVVNYKYLDENIVDVMLHLLQEKAKHISLTYGARNGFTIYVQLLPFMLGILNRLEEDKLSTIYTPVVNQRVLIPHVQDNHFYAIVMDISESKFTVAVHDSLQTQVNVEDLRADDP